MTTYQAWRRLPNGRSMGGMFIASVLALFAFLATFLVALNAHASKLVEGYHYIVRSAGHEVYVKRDMDTREFVRIANTDMFKLRELNPDYTLPVCITDERWVWPNTRTVEERKHATWDCPEEQRYVYLVPDSVITLPMPIESIFEKPAAPPKAEPAESAAPADEVEAPPKAEPAAPVPPTPSPTPPAVAPTPPTPPGRVLDLEDEKNEKDEKIKALTESLDGMESDAKALLAKNEALGRRIDALTAEKAALIRERDVARASIVPSGIKTLVISVLLVLVASLAFVGFKWTSSRSEIVNARARVEAAESQAGSAEGEVANLHGQLRQANAANAQLETAKLAAERARTQLETDVRSAREAKAKAEAGKLEAERLSTERNMRIVELEAQYEHTRSSFVALMTHLFDQMGDPQKIPEGVDLDPFAEAVSRRVTGHLTKFRNVMPRVHELLKEEEEWNEPRSELDLMPVQLFCVAFDRIRVHRDRLMTENASLHDDSIFAAEVTRLQQENERVTVDASHILDENARLKTELQQFHDSQNRELIRRQALEEHATSASVLPGPTEGDHALAALAAQVDAEAVVPATDNGGSVLEQAVVQAAIDHEEEQVPATESGIAPPNQGSDAKAEPVRAHTLPQGMGHVVDILMPGSKDRSELFERFAIIYEAVRQHYGSLKLYSSEEIMTLHQLSTIPIEVFVPREGIQSLKISDFSDPGRTAAYQPVPM